MAKQTLAKEMQDIFGTHREVTAMYIVQRLVNIKVNGRRGSQYITELLFTMKATLRSLTLLCALLRLLKRQCDRTPDRLVLAWQIPYQLGDSLCLKAGSVFHRALGLVLGAHHGLYQQVSQLGGLPVLQSFFQQIGGKQSKRQGKPSFGDGDTGASEYGVGLIKAAKGNHNGIRRSGSLLWV